MDSEKIIQFLDQLLTVRRIVVLMLAWAGIRIMVSPDWQITDLAQVASIMLALESPSGREIVSTKQRIKNAINPPVGK